jgi:ABC-2 type transport system ATP-binding protein
LHGAIALAGWLSCHFAIYKFQITNSSLPPVLEYEHITKRYGGTFSPAVTALEDFSLSVEQGEIFGFLGPNGAGKTTAIHLAMGFMRPSAGHGRILAKPFNDAATRRRIGFLAESVALYHRKAAKVVRFYGALNGLRDPDLARAVRDVIETLDLADVADRNVGKFSRGMLQRVGLAQAFVNDPEFLVLDEPTSALDPLGRVAVRELLLRAKAAGKTIFLSSHLLSEIASVCDRIAIVNRGRLVRVGGTRDLLDRADASEIVARGINAAAFGGETINRGAVRFQVPASQQHAAIERVWASGGEIVHVNPVRRRLEDLFLELTRPNEDDAKLGEDA